MCWGVNGGHRFETENIDNSKKHSAGNGCVAANGLRIKRGLVCRWAIVLRRKTDMFNANGKKSREGEGWQYKRNKIFIWVRAIRICTGIRFRACTRHWLTEEEALEGKNEKIYRHW